MGCAPSKPATSSHNDGRRLLAGEDDMPHPQNGYAMQSMKHHGSSKKGSKSKKHHHQHHHHHGPNHNASHKSQSSNAGVPKRTQDHEQPKRSVPPVVPQQEAPPPLRQSHKQQAQAPPPLQQQQQQQSFRQSQVAARPSPPQPVAQQPKPRPAAPPPKKPHTNQAQNRIDAIEESKVVDTRDIKFRYAYLSQRGRYPNDPHKANQDAYCVHDYLVHKPTPLAPSSDGLYAVFDGHGSAGDGCAQFAKHELPVALGKALQAAQQEDANHHPDGHLSRDAIQQALLKAHVETNQALRNDHSIDDSLSGTTAISLYLHGRRNRMTISNVGDSRAVLGQVDKRPGARSLKALPLSRDQTPYRRDERKRVKAAGARILSLDQLEGLEPINDDSVSDLSGHQEDDFVLGEELDEDGDPPRVWAQNGDYPGTAFTRSIGDAMAEELGVFAEPEMLTREISPDDRIIVLASDGVFEFLTNQSVIDICAKFSDPLEACRAVVAEAYELWLQYELRTDDITMICLFIDEVRVNYDRRSSLSNAPKYHGHKPASAEFSDDELENVALPAEGLKPVRKKVSKEKSKEIEKLKELGRAMSLQPEDESFDWRKLATEKTEEEKESISEAIKAGVMFRNINDEQREMIFSCMESVDVKAGSWVIKQGTVGDRFYIIDEGKFEVRILGDGEDDDGTGGNTVHVYHGSRAINAHPSFGELALMYSAPRSASIVAQTDGHLWALHRSAFRQILVQAQDDRKELKKVLGEIPYFSYMDSDAIGKIASIMSEVTFGRGEMVCDQGRPGKALYVVRSGSAYTTQMMGIKTVRGTVRPNSYFGDEIFSGNGTYGMSVMTLGTMTCWQLDADVMMKQLGPLFKGGN
jgi:serine/threonine protein phosphatase PrpC/CRP-like cAMP-binding protein